MSLAVTVNSITKNRSEFIVRGTIVPSGSYVTAGDTLNFVSATYPVGQGPVPASSAPKAVFIMSQPVGGAGSGYTYGFNKGTTMANGKMSVFQDAGSAAPNAELSAATYPAGVLADTIIFEAVFNAV